MIVRDINKTQFALLTLLSFITHFSLAQEDSLPPEGPFQSTVRIPAPFVSQIDQRWASFPVMCGYLDQGGGNLGGYSCPNPATHATGGCFFSSVAMALQFNGLYQSTFLPPGSNPPELNAFFWMENALSPNDKGWMNLDVTALYNYDRRFVSGVPLYFGLDFEAYGWPAGQDELDNWIAGHTGDPNDALAWYYETDKIPVLRLTLPVDADHDGTQDDSDADGVPDVVGHAVVVTGWDDNTNSYLIHDPLVSPNYYAWEWFIRTGQNLAVNPITGNVHVGSVVTLHRMYYSTQSFDPKIIAPGALNLIDEVWWFRKHAGTSATRSFAIYINSPIEAIASDPDGKRVGFDPDTGLRIREADANYYLQPNVSLTQSIDPTKVLEFRQPKEGKYRAILKGTRNGPYEISFNTGNQTFEGVIEAGETKKIEIDYSANGVVAQETANFIPTAKVTSDRSQVATGSSIRFSATSSSDFDGIIEGYSWNLGDGSGAAGSKIEHQYLQEGSYTVTLTVEDNQGGIATDTMTILVEDPPPPTEPQPPSVTFTQKGGSGVETPSGPYIGLASTGPEDEANVHFHALGANPDGGSPSNWTWIWDFGDGSQSVQTYQWPNWPTGVSGVDHVYQQPGSYIVTVVFNNGIEDSLPATTNVDVLPPLVRNDGTFKLNSQCYVGESKIRPTGRLFYNSSTGLRLPQMWGGGLPLGLNTLREWLDQDFYFVIATEQENEFWFLGELEVRLPDLSFAAEFTLPELVDGNYRAYVVNAEWGALDVDPSTLPQYFDYWPGEALIGASVDFNTPCPAPSNLYPVPDANGPYYAAIGQVITLDGTGSYDPDGNDDALQYEWYVPDGTASAGPLLGPTPQVVFYEPGTYTVSLVVEDELGGETLPSANRPGSFATVTVSESVPNQPPVANAGPDVSISSEEQAQLVIQGSAVEPDGDAMTFRWLQGQSDLTPWQDVSGGEAHLYLNTLSGFLVGAHTLTLEVSDGMASSLDTMVLTIENSAPHTAPSGSGVYELGTPVTLGGFVSDFDGDQLQYSWVEGSQVLHTGHIASLYGGTPVELPGLVISNFALGEHAIQLQVHDGHNDPVSSEIVVSIVDTGVPTMAPVSNRLILWPPNHKMVDIVIVANASDNSGLPVYLTADVTSNEPQDGLGDGDMAPDWTQPVINQETGVIELQLRAERSGTGDGREYAIAITGTDQSGNSSTATVIAIVPHDKR